MTLTRIITLVALTLAIAMLPPHGMADSFCVAPGLGIGFLKNTTGYALGVTGTYREGNPSVSARFLYAQEITIFGSASESASEFAILVGLDNFGDNGASIGFGLGVGKVQSISRGKAYRDGDWIVGTRYEKVRATNWGLAAQFDAFLSRRFGLGFRGNFNDSVSFLTFLLSVRIECVSDK